jgi:hypothetical protein
MPEEQAAHIAGPRHGTFGSFSELKLSTTVGLSLREEHVVDANGTRRFCPQYKSYVVRLRPDGDIGERKEAEDEEPGEKRGGDAVLPGAIPQQRPMQSITRLSELAEIFSPIGSAEEALSYAAAATWGEPLFHTSLLPWTQYLVKEIQDTHVEKVLPANPQQSAATAMDYNASVLFYNVNLYSTEMGGCPGRGRLWLHHVKVFPNGTLVERMQLVAKPCHSLECANMHPLTSPLPNTTSTRRVPDPSRRTYQRGHAPRRNTPRQ